MRNDNQYYCVYDDEKRHEKRIEMAKIMKEESHESDENGENGNDDDGENEN